MCHEEDSECHEETKSFKCGLCSKCFSSQVSLKEHERIHQGVKEVFNANLVGKYSWRFVLSRNIE